MTGSTRMKPTDSGARYPGAQRAGSGHRGRSRLGLAIAIVATIAMIVVIGSTATAGDAVAPGFVVTPEVSRLVFPTNVEFAPDGRMFVTEKRGRLLAFDSIDDSAPTQVIDLSGSIHNFEDRGLLGLAVDPGFPDRPYVYVLYTLDEGNSWKDTCPSPPGIFQDGCVVDGRLSKLTVDETSQLVGDEEVLLDNVWCAQFPSHTVGDLVFLPDGSLVASAGDGADYNSPDWGQRGGSPGSPTPANPCGDPDTEVGTPDTLPGARGGALRSQQLALPGVPNTYDGTIIRVDPDTGEAWPNNPLAGEDFVDRIVAHGLRNPFRMTSRPGTDELWFGDVGWEPPQNYMVVVRQSGGGRWGAIDDRVVPFAVEVVGGDG